MWSGAFPDGWLVRKCDLANLWNGFFVDQRSVLLPASSRSGSDPTDTWHSLCAFARFGCAWRRLLFTATYGWRTNFTSTRNAINRRDITTITAITTTFDLFVDVGLSTS